MGKNDLDGQLNLFGSDPYQPKKAKANEEQVELSTEAEEFLSVGRRKKKAPEEQPPEEKPAMEKSLVEEKPVVADKPPEEQPPAEEAPQAEKPKVKPQSDAVVMQQSFANASGKPATVAYLDYNCVYVQEPSGKAAMTHYRDAKTAVDRYLETVARFAKTEGLKKSKEHPALKRVKCEEAE